MTCTVLHVTRSTAVDGAGVSLSDYERQQIEAIKSYEAQEPSVAARTLDFLFSPAAWIVQKVVPVAAIEGAMRGSSWLAEQTIDKQNVLRNYGIEDFSEVLRMPLKQLDEEADSVHDWAVAFATAEGGAAGAIGILSAPADIAFIVTLALRTIRRIGYCYGYHEINDVERQFIFAILSEAAANTQAQKAAALTTLRAIQVQLLKQTWKSLAQQAAAKPMSTQGAVMAIKELAKQLGINLTKRKALAAVPIIGAVTGAAVNGTYLGDIGWAARRAFQRRWLVDNDLWIEA